MDNSQDEIRLDCAPVCRVYKSGRIDRLHPSTTAPAGVDPTTGVQSKDVTITATVSARLYLPPTANSDEKLPILFYFHGGGFIIQSAFSPTYQPFLTSLASRAHVLVVSVNYRLAPEHPLPAAYDDSWATLGWALGPNPTDPWLARHGDSRHVFVAGDSAGANISHQMVVCASAAAEDSTVKITGMVLIHPYFWGRERIQGETTAPEMLGLLERLWRLANNEDQDTADLDHPWINPFVTRAINFSQMRCERVMVCVAGRDVLAPRGMAYHAALAGSGWGGGGAPPELVVSEGEDHVFFLEDPEGEKAVELIEKIAGFLKIGA